MASGSRPKRDTKEPARFTPWEERDTSMMGVKKAKSREKNKNKNYMKQYCEKASKDTKGKEEEEVEEEVEEVGVEEMVEEEGLGGGDMGKKKSKKKVTFNQIERLFLFIVSNKALIRIYFRL